MVVIDRVYAGGSVQTTASGSFTPTVPGVGATFTVADATGYPSSGKFVVKINRGLSDEEKVLVDSRSGTVFTVGARGYDGTTAQSHSAGATVEHALDATAINQMVQHVDDVEADPHSTKLLNNTRHDVTARHTFGVSSALGNPSAPPAVTIGGAGSAGVGSSPSRSDHAHAGPTSGSPVAVGTALSAGSGTDVALANHVHELGAGSIDTSSFFAAGVVNAAALATDAVTTAKIQNAQVTLAKLASEAWTTYTPSNQNVTIGTGGFNVGKYIKAGRSVHFQAGFELGTGGDVTGLLGIGLPPFTYVFPASGYNLVVGGWCQNAAGTSRFAFSGIVADTSPTLANRFVNAATNLGFDADNPFNWAAGFQCFITGVLETTT